jgi:hypothetical protein
MLRGLQFQLIAFARLKPDSAKLNFCSSDVEEYSCCFSADEDCDDLAMPAKCQITNAMIKQLCKWIDG